MTVYSKQYTPKERKIKIKSKTKQNNILFLNINFYSVKKAAKGQDPGGMQSGALKR